ncbi:MAG: helix-turn-helix transcriptional regulator [Rhodocyclaceae bacterium]|nr:helix-turn-helix transcriptional regulator [Rhodocyclaceae bacterium]
MDTPNRHLADTLRNLRRQRQWSLDAAAARTGVSKAMLGQIERGESSPTVATLWKIAGGFETSLSSLLVPTPPACSEPEVRRAADLRRSPAEGEMLVAPLFPFDERLGFEVFELTLPAGYVRRSAPHEPGVTEHVLVVAGCMAVCIGDRWHALAPSEAIRFAADQPHGYRNDGDSPAVFHNLIHYPRQWGRAD